MAWRCILVRSMRLSRRSCSSASWSQALSLSPSFDLHSINKTNNRQSPQQTNARCSVPDRSCDSACDVSWDEMHAHKFRIQRHSRRNRHMLCTKAISNSSQALRLLPSSRQEPPPLVHYEDQAHHGNARTTATHFLVSPILHVNHEMQCFLSLISSNQRRQSRLPRLFSDPALAELHQRSPRAISQHQLPMPSQAYAQNCMCSGKAIFLDIILCWWSLSISTNLAPSWLFLL